ncbi:unnamed protein product, partial [Heterosigma akashiwo]
CQHPRCQQRQLFDATYACHSKVRESTDSHPSDPPACPGPDARGPGGGFLGLGGAPAGGWR